MRYFFTTILFLFLFAIPVFATEMYNDTSYNTSYSADSGYSFGFRFDSGSFTELTDMQLDFLDSENQSVDIVICDYTFSSPNYTCNNTVYTDTTTLTTAGGNNTWDYTFGAMTLLTDTDYIVDIEPSSAIRPRIDTANEHSDVEMVNSMQNYYLGYDIVGVINADTAAPPTFNYVDFDDMVATTICGQGDFTCNGTYAAEVFNGTSSTSPYSVRIKTDTLLSTDSLEWTPPDSITDEHYKFDLSHNYEEGTVFGIAFFNVSNVIHTYLTVEDDGTVYVNGQSTNKYILDSNFHNIELDIDVTVDCARVRVDQSTWSNCKNYGVTDNATTYIRMYSTDTSGQYSYVDNIGTLESSPVSTSTPVTDSQMTWFFPQNGYNVSNDDFSDWGIYYELYPEDLYEYLLMKVYYQDSLGIMHLDQDFISTTTELTYWTINKSATLPQGNTTAWAEIIGTNLENCSTVGEDSCLWYGSANLETIYFNATSTGNTVFDYGLTGFQPSTSTLIGLYGATSTAEYSFIKSFIDDLVKSLRIVFPFNIGANILHQWNISDTLVLPDAFGILTTMFNDGNIYLDLPASIFGESATSTPVYGQLAFQSIDSDLTLFQQLRSLSTLLLYLMFAVGVVLRGKSLYQEYVSPSQVRLATGTIQND